MATLVLTLFEPEHDPNWPDRLTGYPLAIQAEGRGMPSEVFVYHAAAQNGLDVFEGLATPATLEELPLNRAETQGDNPRPFYLRSRCEIWVRQPEEAERVWEAIRQDCRKLVRSMNAQIRLEGLTAIEISEDGQTELDDLAPVDILLSSAPATEADLDSEAEIVTPDPLAAGWLPVEYLDGEPVRPDGYSQNPPAGARYYYNASLDANLLAELPPAEPHAQHVLLVDGHAYDRNQVWGLTADTVYWLQFDPQDFTDSSNNPPPPARPWPSDWLPGAGSAVPREIRLVLRR